MDFTSDFDGKIDHSLTQGSLPGQKTSQAVSTTSSTDDFEHVDPFSSHNLLDDDNFFSGKQSQTKEDKPLAGDKLLDDFLSGGPPVTKDLPKPKEPDFGNFGLSDDFGGFGKTQANVTKNFMDAERSQQPPELPPKAPTPPLLDQIEDDYLNPYSTQKEKFVSSEDFLDDFKDPPPPVSKAPEPIIPKSAPIEIKKEVKPPTPEPPKPLAPPPAEPQRPKAEPPKPPQASAPAPPARKLEERIAAEEMFCRIGLGYNTVVKFM
ncbi:hypothetical protein DMENIID0001_035890 [Sergentomyia squamirostris]